MEGEDSLRTSLIKDTLTFHLEVLLWWSLFGGSPAVAALTFSRLIRSSGMGKVPVHIPYLQEQNWTLSEHILTA